MKADLPIGIIDSGVGGISVLREAVKTFPNEKFLYFGDNANAPFGTKPRAQIREFLFAMYDRLMQLGVKALIIACNTAMSVAGDELIEKAEIPVVGIFPDISQLSGDTIVLATPATLQQPRFLCQYEPRKQEVEPVPCAGLVEFVEREELSGANLEQYFQDILGENVNRKFDNVLLGCTHYIFVQDTVEKIFPGVPVTSGIEAVLLRMRKKLEEKNLLRTEGELEIELMTSGDPEKCIALMKKLLYC